ncbi:MAG: molecular chaperone DnaJ [Bacteroidales bacterium]|nr:molecular chaperone DnaJ [Bacteroidales bacterium]
MAEKRDYYEVLGVNKNSTPDEIKSAYRKAALKWHPDKWVNGTDAEKKTAEENFKEASEAYSVLSDENKKARYDRYGFAGMDGSSASGGGGFGGFGDFDLNDILNSVFGRGFDFGGGFSGFSGFGSGSSRGGTVKQRGSNIRVKVKLNLQEIAHGVKKKIKVSKYVACTHCHGSGSEDGSTETCPTCHGRGQVVQTVNSFFGQMQTASVCPTCNGTGTVIKKKCTHCGGEGIMKGDEVIDIDIPAGVGEGMQLTVRGKGNAGPHNGVNGDLLVLIEEEPHPDFERDESTLIYNLFITIPEAILGTQAEVPTVDGKVRVKIAPGTQSGKVLRLRGKGLPILNGYGSGDMLVNVNVWVPKKVSKEEEQLLQQLGQSQNFKPNPSPEEKSFFNKIKDYFN